MKTPWLFLFVFLAVLVICAPSASGQSTPLLIITNRTLIDNQFIFGQNAASPPTLSKRVIDTTHRGVYGLSPTDSVIKASTSIQGGIMTGNPSLSFSGHTITRTGGTGAQSWVSDGFAQWQYIFVRNTTSNNIVRGLLTDVTPTVLTLNSTNLTTESGVSGVTVRGGDRFVTVEDFGHSSLDDGRFANVAGLTIDGNQPMPSDALFTSITELPLSLFGSTYAADGVAVDGEFPTAQNLIVQKFRGIGIAHQSPNGRVFDCVVRACHTGVKLPSSDSEISRCRLYDCRDACLWITAFSGNCQSLNNHCYGARIACYNEGGGPFRATNDTYADSFVGYLGQGQSDLTVLTNCFFQHNKSRDVVFQASGGHLLGCVVNVQRPVKNNSFDTQNPAIPTFQNKVGVQFDNERCSFRDGSIEMHWYKHPAEEYDNDHEPATGIVINGDFCTVETNLVDFDRNPDSYTPGDASDRTRGIKILGARRGINIDCWVIGFNLPDERLLVVESGDQKELHCVFRGAFDNLTNPGTESAGVKKYIDIPSGWHGSIRLIDTTTGAFVDLTETTAY